LFNILDLLRYYDKRDMAIDWACMIQIWEFDWQDHMIWKEWTWKDIN
jgi:hypothetical protein